MFGGADVWRAGRERSSRLRLIVASPDIERLPPFPTPFTLNANPKTLSPHVERIRRLSCEPARSHSPGAAHRGQPRRPHVRGQSVSLARGPDGERPLHACQREPRRRPGPGRSGHGHGLLHRRPAGPVRTHEGGVSGAAAGVSGRGGRERGVHVCESQRGRCDREGGAAGRRPPRHHRRTGAQSDDAEAGLPRRRLSVPGSARGRPVRGAGLGDGVHDRQHHEQAHAGRPGGAGRAAGPRRAGAGCDAAASGRGVGALRIADCLGGRYGRRAPRDRRAFGGPARGRTVSPSGPRHRPVCDARRPRSLCAQPGPGQHAVRPGPR